MKLFGEKLKEAISKNGFSVYRLAKMADVERTGLQRCLSGQRLISEDSLLKILDLLCLDAEERTDLLKSLMTEQIGEEKYQQREIIQNLTESLFHFCTSKPAPFQIEKQIRLSGNFQISAPVSGRYTVLHMVQNLIEYEISQEEAPCINMYLPRDREFLNRIIPSADASKKKIVFQQLIQLFVSEAETEAADYNLELLDIILPFHLSTGMDYRVHYQYTDDFCEHHFGVALPYYIILNQRLLISLSEDLECAYLFDSKEYILFYQNYFESLLKSSPILVYHYENLEQMLSHYKGINVGKERLFIMEFEPCFFSLMDPDMVERYLPADIENREYMLSMILEHLKQMKASASPCCLVSHKGIEYFVQTGAMADVPPGLELHLTPSDRFELLSRLRKQCLTDEGFLRIINPEYFNFPDFITIRAGYTCGVDFSISDQEGNFRFLYITENTLSKVWADFIENSLNSSMAYSKEKTLEKLDEYIEKIIIP